MYRKRLSAGLGLLLALVLAAGYLTGSAQATPNAWTSVDIGTGTVGSTTLNPTNLWVKGSGSDIWNSSDSFRYVYNSTGSDLEFTTKVTQWNGSANEWSKAGLMIRTSTAANAPYLMVNVTGQHGIQLQWRSTAGGNTGSAAGPTLALPLWLKVRKAGATLAGFYSTNGSTWTQVGASQSISLANPFLYGMAITSHSNGWYADATFDSPWIGMDIGTKTAGQTNLNGTGVWVKGSGADIWGGSDSFRYVSNAATGDLAFSARVTQWNGSSNEWSKAGLMIRSTSNANSPYLFVGVTGQHGLQMQWRSTSGGASASAYGPTFTLPIWLRVVRSGSTLTAYSSTNGSTWTQVGGAQSIGLNSTYLYGFAVTAHADGAFADATFDSISAGSTAPSSPPTPTPTASAPSPTPTLAGLSVAVNRTTSDATNQLRFGSTHTLYSADSWNNAGAVSSARSLLQNGVPYQNQHIMGFGVSNPEPSPGTYDWGSLDNRVALMRQTGGTMILTLCCAPDWMKGGAAGTTDWTKIGIAPLPSHYADFADLARRAALRYPDIQYFQVWNQLKGFWDSSKNRWNYEAYTQFYNVIYDAVKSANPNAKIGGPYVVMDTYWNRNWMSNPSSVSDPAWGTLDQRPLDVINYWLANKHGGDFLSINAGVVTRDAGLPPDLFAAEKKFADVTTYLKTKTSLPIWWSEWEATRWSNETLPHNQQNALMTTAMIGMARAGATMGLKWQPQGDNTLSYQGDQESVWTDTRISGGGQPFPFYNTVKAFKDYFGPGTALYPVTISDPTKIAALASATRIMVVNKTGGSLTVNVNGASVTLAPYEVKVQ